MKIGVLRNSTRSTGKHLCQSLFFYKVASLRQQNTSGRLLLIIFYIFQLLYEQFNLGISFLGENNKTGPCNKNRRDTVRKHTDIDNLQSIINIFLI